MAKKEVENFEKQSKTTVEDNVKVEPTMNKEEPVKKIKKVKITKDALETKHYAWLAYILFFIPLLINSKSPFVRHHANEGLEINVFDGVALVLLLLGVFLPKSVEWVHLLTIIFTFLGLGLFLLTIVTKIYMITDTLKGKTTCTPWMWDVRIIK